MLALNRADALVYVGLDLEVGWLPPLVQQARNARIQRGQPGNIDASTAIRPEDVPNVPSDQLRALGDIHPLGNPHYWIPPKNARAIARLLAERFTALDAGGAAAYKAELARFEAQLRPRRRNGSSAAAPLQGHARSSRYHKSWSYVARWLGLEEVGYIEPKPGIPPDREPHRAARRADEEDRRAPGRSSSRSTRARWRASSPTTASARLVAAPSNVGATPAIKTYFDLVDAVIAALKGG